MGTPIATRTRNHTEALEKTKGLMPKIKRLLSFANPHLPNPRKVRWFLRSRSTRVRHSLARLIAPELCTAPTYIPRPFPSPMIKFVGDKFGCRSLVGVEIGVSGGWNAESILETLLIEKLFLIDPYQPYIEEGKRISREKYLPQAKERLARFGDKVQFIIKQSADAIEDIQDGLDFVFIDGNHTYEYVKQDITLYYPKVRNGGVIGGDDFTSDWFGVCRAVLEYAEEHGLRLHGENPNWWIIK